MCQKQIGSWKWRVVAVIAVSVAALAIPSTGLTQEDGLHLLSKLRKFNSAVLDNFTLDVQIVSPRSSPTVLDTERLSRTVRVAMKDNVWAYRAILDETMAAPQYRPPGGEVPAADYSRQGELHLWRPYVEYGLYEDTFRGVHTTMKQYKVGADGEVAERVISPTVNLRNAQDGLELHDVYIPILSAGYGYATLLDEITEVSEQEGGLLECTGIGRYTDGTPCRWELTVDPTAAYMVRRAKCIRQDNGYVLAIMENEGAQWYSRGVLPEKARFTFDPKHHGTSAEGSFEVTFVDLVDKADDELIADARRLLRGSFPKGTEILDWRANPEDPLHFVVGEAPVSERSLMRMFEKPIAEFGADLAESPEPRQVATEGSQSPGAPPARVQPLESTAEPKDVTRWRTGFFILLGVVIIVCLVGLSAYWGRRRRNG